MSGVQPQAPGSSGSVVQRRGETKEQAETREKKAEAQKKQCPLHQKKAKAGCKFCKQYADLVAEAEKKPEKDSGRGGRDGRSGRKLDRAISEERETGVLELANPKTFGFSGLLQTHIIECAHYKALASINTFEQLVDETYQFSNTIEPYMANSGTLPSALFCCLYRFFQINLDGRQVRKLIESQESPYIRCVGLLYCRLGLPHNQVLPWIGEYLLDDEEFKPTQDGDLRMTIGEMAEGLLSMDKYFTTVLPRLPMVTKRQVEEKLAPLQQNRKRMQANKRCIHIFRNPGLRVEVNIAGEWLRGGLIELDEDAPTRPKVRVRLEDGSEEYVHLGKVVIADSERGRSRSRSRDRRGGYRRSRSRTPTDWSRQKGRSDRELIDELRSKERDKAVCSSGKEYARKPVGYKAACALPREQGAASFKLMEEETFVPMARAAKRGRSPSPEKDNFGSHRPSAEHQARMQQLFEKYGNVKSTSDGGGAHNDIDRVDTLRLG